MIITKTSPISGRVHQRDITITPLELARWKAGAYIQDVCPNLCAEDREFLISGITPEEWENAFPEDDDEDEICVSTRLNLLGYLYRDDLIDGSIDLIFNLFIAILLLTALFATALFL